MKVLFGRADLMYNDREGFYVLENDLYGIINLDGLRRATIQSTFRSNVNKCRVFFGSDFSGVATVFK